MEFELKPYIGALPITFDMGAAEVEKCIGPAKSAITVGGELDEFRKSKQLPAMPLHVFYSETGKVVEIGFNKGSVLKYKGVDLFKEKNTIRLLAADDQAKENKGTIVFLKFGVAMRGFHDPVTKKDIVVFCRGRWDFLVSKLVNFEVK